MKPSFCDCCRNIRHFLDSVKRFLIVHLHCNFTSLKTMSKKADVNFLKMFGRPVVCLRGGERGTCLGPPLVGGPLEVLRA